MGNCCYTYPEEYGISAHNDTEEEQEEQAPQDLFFRKYDGIRFAPYIRHHAESSDSLVSVDNIEYYN